MRVRRVSPIKLTFALLIALVVGAVIHLWPSLAGTLPGSLDETGIMLSMFPGDKITRSGKATFIDGSGQTLLLNKIVRGAFVSDHQEALVIVTRPGSETTNHAEGLFQAYAAVLSSEGSLLGPVKELQGDEGQTAVFNGTQRSYLFFVSAVTYQGDTSYTGGLWRASRGDWTLVWPEDPSFWEQHSVEVSGDKLAIYRREAYRDNPSQLIPFYRWAFSHQLRWDPEAETFR